MNVCIQFCGGCNPRIDRGRIALELKKALEGMGHKVAFNSPDCSLAIFLSGCKSGCALKYNPRNPPYITVADHTVDTEAVDEAGIVLEVLRKVDEYDDQLETEICK